MKQEADIPCATCSLWNSKAKSFSCNPNSCTKLSRWLLKNAQVTPCTVQMEVAPIQYVV